MPRPQLGRDEAATLASEEYEALVSTYSKLIQQVSLTQEHQLDLTSLEGERFLVQVSAEGWKVVEGGLSEERTRTWEMIEDLLRSVSPRFKSGWDQLLVEKLRLLAEQGSGAEAREEPAS
jgi:Protein of unknown function (DUF727)